MSFFKKLLGRKSGAAPQVLQTGDPARDPNLVRVHDGYGREIFIPKTEWRDKVLIPNLRMAWNKPNELYNLIVSGLKDGFRREVLDAARHLYEVEPLALRAANLWGVILTEEGQLDEAESVFREFMTREGESGLVLVNLAKVFAKRNDERRTEDLIWRGLELEPNQENGLMWFVARHREKDGPAAELAAFHRVAGLPGSWRAHLWLARAALQSRDLESALRLYRESLSRSGKPVPYDLLMQMSGDLGNSGHLPEILQLVEPHFDVSAHGLQVGNNLIKAHLDLGQLDHAKRLLDQLYAQKRPDWQQTLTFWDTEIAKTRVSTVPRADPSQIKVGMLTIEGPVWLKPESPASELFPISKDGSVICFLGSSAERNVVASQTGGAQMPDPEGRLSRALPLFLAEQVELLTASQARTLVPWIVEPVPSFAVTRTAWKDEDAATYARQGDIKADYVVITHLRVDRDPWHADLRLVRTIDGKCLGTLDSAFLMASPQGAFPNLAKRLLALLAEQSQVSLHAPPESYQVPSEEQFPLYLLHLEQLLVARCGGMDGVSDKFISGEHEILDGNIQSCLGCPKNIIIRIVLAQTLLAMKRVRPDIIPLYREKIALLQKDFPLPQPADAVIQRLFNDAFAA